MNDKFNKSPQTETISDERIVKVVRGLLDAIICDSSTKVLVVSARGGGSNNGLRIGRILLSEIVKKGGQGQIVMHKPVSWEVARDEKISRLLLDDFNLLFVTDMDSLGYDGIGRQKVYVLDDGRKFNEIIYYRRAKKEIRGFCFMVNNLERFIESVDVNYNDLGKISVKFFNEFRKIRKLKIISGDESELEIATRSDYLPMADFNFEQDKLGSGCNVPFGEVLISPDNNFGEGSIVVDGSFYGDDTVTISEPIKIHFKGGRAVKIEGGREAKILKEYLEKEERRTRETIVLNSELDGEYLENIRRIGEFAVGLNPKAIFCDDLLIDEKVSGSAHIALGRNYHGDPAFVHVDLVVKKPKVVFVYKNGFEKVVLEDGKILLQK
jgi:hypothetical protein